jgi:hypothetical protein
MRVCDDGTCVHVATCPGTTRGAEAATTAQESPECAIVATGVCVRVCVH